MMTLVMPLDRTDPSSLTLIVREFAEVIMGASNPNEPLNQQNHRSSFQITRKLLRDLRALDDDTDFFNPGTLYLIGGSDDDARSEM
jgi:hypothetical protein